MHSMPIQTLGSPGVPDDVKAWFGRSEPDDLPPHYVRDWLGEVVRANYRLLYYIAYGFDNNPSSAEDLVQTAVLTGLQKLRQLREPEVVVGWLAAIVRNQCLQARRRMVNAVSIDDHMDDVFAPSSIEQHRFDDQRLLVTALNNLPETLASVVRLRFFGDYDIVEIAALLGLRRNTAEVRLHRALKQLAKDPTLRALRG
jgi:RNA polymerase sigma factor (sigma-70 family)